MIGEMLNTKMNDLSAQRNSYWLQIVSFFTILFERTPESIYFTISMKFQSSGISGEIVKKFLLEDCHGFKLYLVNILQYISMDFHLIQLASDNN